MGIESFFTLQSLLPGAQNPGTGKALSTPVQIQGLGFIDMILARLLESAKTQPSPAEQPATPLQSENPLLDKNPGLDLAELLAVTPGVEEEVKNFITAPGTSLTPEQQLAQTMALNQKALDDALKPLSDGIITLENLQNGSPRILQALLIDTDKDRKGVLDSLALILDKLKRLAEDNSGAGLALTNLTPEQITQLQAKIEMLLAKAKTAQQVADAGAAIAQGMQEDSAQADEDEQIAGIVLGLIRILPPQARPEVIVMPRGLVITPRPLEIVSTPETSKPANDLAAKLNNLVVGDNADASGEENFGDLIKQFSGKKETAPGLDLAKDASKSNAPGVKPDLSALQNWPFASDGSLRVSFESFSQNNFPLTGFTLTGPASLTSPLTQAAHAGTPMPAIQLVAATIQKAASDGQNKNFVLQLEPPDLGRIEVRLNFGKDKTVKAVVMAERGEALTMLSRDAHVLERALTAAGLDADGSLSFELAEDGHFSHDGGHDGAPGHGGGGGAGEGEIIESTMTWYVDPETGHMRYDLFV